VVCPLPDLSIVPNIGFGAIFGIAHKAMKQDQEDLK
jgi:hypothetical protein